MNEALCNLPTATVRLSGIASAQLMEGYVTEYESIPGKLHKHPLRLLICSVQSGGFTMSRSLFPSISYYGDDIYSALDCLFEAGYFNDKQHVALLNRATETVEKYNHDIAEFDLKRAEAERVENVLENIDSESEELEEA